MKTLMETLISLAIWSALMMLTDYLWGYALTLPHVKETLLRWPPEVVIGIEFVVFIISIVASIRITGKALDHE